MQRDRQLYIIIMLCFQIELMSVVLNELENIKTSNIYCLFLLFYLFSLNCSLLFNMTIMMSDREKLVFV
jgi:hypothetical protein